MDHGPSALPEPNPADAERLQALLAKAHQAWQAGGTVHLDSFLPREGDALRPVALVRLVEAELETCWRQGQTPVLEDFLKKYPELHRIPSAWPGLLAHEYRQRHLYGDRPSLVDYQGRYPDQYPEFHRLLGNPSATLPPTDAPPTGKGDVNLAGGAGYTLHERLGRGSFGEVWRAEAPGGVEVAVKIVFRPLDHADAQQELEALNLIKKLRHPFLLALHAFWSLDDRLVIAMELAEGSLRDRLKQCLKAGEVGLPREELIGYLGEAAEALDYLHAQQVVHRDIKPDNILLIQRHAQLADLGLARLLEGQGSFQATVCGSPSYMAPEVFRRKASTHSDQYSLAATYVELRRGSPPFVGRDLIELMQLHLEAEPDLASLPEGEQVVLRQALAKSPEERYASCRHFWEALRQAPAEPPLTEVGPAIPPQAEGVLGGIPTRVQVNVPGPPTVQTMAAPTAHDSAVLPLPPQPDARPARPRALRWWAALGLLPLLAVGVAVILKISHSPPPELPPPVIPTPKPEVPQEPILLPQAPEGEYVPDAGASVTQIGGLPVYDRVAYVLPDGTRLVFLLIPRHREDEPAPFYILRTKVSNRMFRYFAQQHPERLHSETEWRKGAKDLGVEGEQLDWPVLCVRADEAHQFAAWLGGKLPTAQQWDKAAGRFDGDPGPFKGDPEKGEPKDYAVGLESPVPVGPGPGRRDESRYGVWDMAGNGYEWTASIRKGRDRETDPVPFHQKDDCTISLRGCSYREREPFQYAAANQRQRNDPPDDDMGFRVALPLPAR